MAKHIKVAVTARTCGPLPQNATQAQLNQAVLSYIELVLANVCHQKPDLLLLPEMCDLPENMVFEEYVEHAKTKDNTVLDFVKQAAKKNNMWIAFSIIEKSTHGKLRNTCMLINRNGKLDCAYSKIHLTQGELDAGIEAGENLVIHECELGKIGFAICFDLNYTSLAQRYQQLGVNIILFPSLFHGGLLQNMWALSARSWLLGSSGNIEASVIAPTGELAAKSTIYHKEQICLLNVDYALLHLDFNKPKLEKALLKYKDKIKITDPDRLASVMLTSESKDISVTEIISEFALETLDDYLNRLSKQIKTSEIVEEKV